jgi:hypothetical protein
MKKKLYFQFYFIHNQAPALKKTEIIDLDIDNVRPPLFYDNLLPPIWKKFRNRVSRWGHFDSITKLDCSSALRTIVNLAFPAELSKYLFVATFIIFVYLPV